LVPNFLQLSFCWFIRDVSSDSAVVDWLEWWVYAPFNSKSQRYKVFKVVLTTIPIGWGPSSTQSYRCTPRHLWPHIMIKGSQDNSKSVTGKPVNVFTFTNITSNTKPPVDPDGSLHFYHYLTVHFLHSTQSPRSILTAHYFLPQPTPCLHLQNKTKQAVDKEIGLDQDPISSMSKPFFSAKRH
jgi:hypothetical protein